MNIIQATTPIIKIILLPPVCSETIPGLDEPDIVDVVGGPAGGGGGAT